MLVFYSGWGYWEFEPEDAIKDISPQTLSGRLQKVCCLFDLPRDSGKEITYQGETVTSYLLYSSCSETDMEPPENINEEIESRFILCEEPSRNYIINNIPVNEISIRFTKNDIVEDPKVDDKPKNLTETERNTMLKVIIGMAIDAYGYDPEKKRNPFTGDKNGLSAKLLTHGINVTDETIRKYLDKAKELM